MRIRAARDLGSLIRSRRKALGLNQLELAQLVGVSRLWVNEVEKGKPRAEVGLVLRALSALGLIVDIRSDHSDTTIDAVVAAARKHHQ